MTCTHRLDNDPTGLLCTLADGHAPGCVFKGSGVPDGHDVSEQRAEADRG